MNTHGPQRAGRVDEHPLFFRTPRVSPEELLFSCRTYFAITPLGRWRATTVVDSPKTQSYVDVLEALMFDYQLNILEHYY